LQTGQKKFTTGLQEASLAMGRMCQPPVHVGLDCRGTNCSQHYLHGGQLFDFPSLWRAFIASVDSVESVWTRLDYILNQNSTGCHKLGLGAVQNRFHSEAHGPLSGPAAATITHLAHLFMSHDHFVSAAIWWPSPSFRLSAKNGLREAVV
jgi:hypothetical protein